MRPISSIKQWSFIYWLQKRLELQGRFEEFVEKLGCEFSRSRPQRRKIRDLATREYGFVNWRSERQMVDAIIAAKDFLEADAKLAPAEIVKETEEAKQKELDKLAAPISSPAPQAIPESSGEDFIANVAWVLANMRTYVRRDPGVPVRIINVGRLKKQAPSEAAITLLMWSADNLNKFMELAFRVLPKKQEKEVQVDEKHFEDDDDVESLKRALAESQM
jgi:hypothetical protein